MAKKKEVDFGEARWMIEEHFGAEAGQQVDSILEGMDDMDRSDLVRLGAALTGLGDYLTKQVKASVLDQVKQSGPIVENGVTLKYKKGYPRVSAKKSEVEKDYPLETHPHFYSKSQVSEAVEIKIVPLREMPREEVAPAVQDDEHIVPLDQIPTDDEPDPDLDYIPF